MTERTYNVLFLCTGNSARSVLAEGILRKDGEGHFTAYSAGSQPKGTVNPLALKVLGDHGYPTDGYPLEKLGRVRGSGSACHGLRAHRLRQRGR